MIIKTFVAESSAAALKQVREEMGGEAIVLRTTQVDSEDGRSVCEITACVDRITVGRSSRLLEGTKPPPVATPKPASGKNIAAPRSADAGRPAAVELQARMDAIDRKLDQLLQQEKPLETTPGFRRLEPLYRQLHQQDVPDEFIEGFVRSILDKYRSDDDLNETIRLELVERLAAMATPVPDFRPGQKVLFIGPAGAGKSTALGKLAAQLVHHAQRTVKLLTLDDFKMAAFEEIHSYGQILGVEVMTTDADAVASGSTDAVLLIDSPAMPADKERITALKERIDFVVPDYRLAVFSCLTRSRDVLHFSRMIRELHPTHLVMTMRDLTGCPGSMLAAAQATGVPIVLVGDCPPGMGYLKSVDVVTLASELLGEGVLS